MAWYKQDKPIVFFDLETTGSNTKKDRIVEIAILRIESDGNETEYCTQVNPEMPIPPETTEIHGITDEDVENCPTFEKISEKIEELFEGADLSGYNIRRFDCPLLAEEFKRIGNDFKWKSARIIDPMIIYHKRNPRTLGAAYEHYIGKELVDAHSALADCRASYDILKAQFDKHDDLSTDPDALHSECNKPYNKAQVDPDGMVVYHFRKPIFKRGKHKGKNVEDVIEEDRSYVEWMATSGTFTPELEKFLSDCLAK